MISDGRWSNMTTDQIVFQISNFRDFPPTYISIPKSTKIRPHKFLAAAGFVLLHRLHLALRLVLVWSWRDTIVETCATRGLQTLLAVWMCTFRRVYNCYAKIALCQLLRGPDQARIKSRY